MRRYRTWGRSKCVGGSTFLLSSSSSNFVFSCLDGFLTFLEDHKCTNENLFFLGISCLAGLLSPLLLHSDQAALRAEDESGAQTGGEPFPAARGFVVLRWLRSSIVQLLLLRLSVLPHRQRSYGRGRRQCSDEK